VEFDTLLEIIFGDHESMIERINTELGNAQRDTLTNNLSIAKRIINSSEDISFESVFDVLETMYSRKFNLSYAQKITKLDSEADSDRLISYYVCQQANQDSSDKLVRTKFAKALRKCEVTVDDGTEVFNHKKFANKFVFVWLTKLRPEQKLFMVTLFNDETLINDFGLQVLINAAHEFIELAVHCYMTGVLVTCIQSSNIDKESHEFKQTLNLHIQAIYQLSQAITTIIVASAIPILTDEDANKIGAKKNSSSTEHARSFKKEVSDEARSEWREYAKTNWKSLPMRRNQVSHMAEHIVEHLESATEFSVATVHDNIKNIKKHALN